MQHRLEKKLPVRGQYKVTERLRSSDDSEPHPPESEVERLSQGRIKTYENLLFDGAGLRHSFEVHEDELECWQKGKTKLDNYQEERFSINSLVESFSKLRI